MDLVANLGSQAMDHLPLAAAATSDSEPKHARALIAYRKALATAASVAAYSVMARSIARDLLLPDELRATARWGARLVLARLFAPAAAEKKRRTLVIHRHADDGRNRLFGAVRAYLETKMDPRAMPRLAIAASARCKEATFDTLAMDPELKQSIVADLDRFLKRKEYYRRIGKAWKRGYLLYGPPGTGKSSLIAAMANYLRFDLFDLDLSEVRVNAALQRLLIGMPNKAILVIEDIDCCFDAKPREDHNTAAALEEAVDYLSGSDDDGFPPPKARRAGDLQQHKLTLSGLLNFIDGLWSTSGEQRIIVFTTNYKERLDPALLRPGRMDMHVYMGYCSWEAFKTLAHNYFLIDDHPLFPEIQVLLVKAEVTPAEVSEMFLRSEDADVALRGLMELLRDRRQRAEKEAEIKNDGKSSEM